MINVLICRYHVKTVHKRCYVFYIITTAHKCAKNKAETQADTLLKHSLPSPLSYTQRITHSLSRRCLNTFGACRPRMQKRRRRTFNF